MFLGSSPFHSGSKCPVAKSEIRTENLDLRTGNLISGSSSFFSGSKFLVDKFEIRTKNHLDLRTRNLISGLSNFFSVFSVAKFKTRTENFIINIFANNDGDHDGDNSGDGDGRDDDDGDNGDDDEEYNLPIHSKFCQVG